MLLLLLSTYLDTLQVNRVHNGALEKLDGGEMTLEQTLKLQVGWLSTRIPFGKIGKIEKWRKRKKRLI